MFKNIFERYALQVNNLQAPGEAANHVAVFVGPTKEFYNEYGVESIDDYVNIFAIPWAFMNGINCSGMYHGSWATSRHYKSPEEVCKSKEEDYSVDPEILNYVMGLMSAANQMHNGTDKIILIGYYSEGGVTICIVYDSEEAFANGIKEDLEYFEEGKED